MAGGILDFLNSPDAQLGIGLLAAGGPTTDPNQSGFGQRLAGAMNSVTANQQIALRAKLMQSQIDENASQNALRQATLAQQAKREAYFMGDGGLAGGSAPAANGIPGSAGLPGGAPMAAPGVVANGSPVAQGGDRFSQWSAQYGIPRDALVNDYLANGGKGIAEMLAKRGTPDMQVSNGYAYDKNKLGAGFLPQVNTSANGQTSVIVPNGEGSVDVGAPRGAVNTFRAYQNASNLSGAQTSESSKPVYNEKTGRWESTSRAAALGLPPLDGGNGAAPANAMPDYRAAFKGLPAAQPGMTSSFEGDPAKVLPLIAAMKDPQERANAYDAYSRQMTGGAAPANAGNVVDLSAAEKTANKVAEEKAIGQAKADIVPAADKVKTIDSANTALAVIDKALKHPGLNAGTGLQGAVDPRNYIPGTDARDFRVVLDQLKGTAFLTAFEKLKGGGAITEMEGAKAEAAIARLNRAQSTNEFKTALGEYKTILERGLARANGGSPAEPSGGEKSFKDFGYNSQADVLKDAQNTILKNPKTKPEVMRRLKEMGITLNEGSW